MSIYQIKKEAAFFYKNMLQYQMLYYIDFDFSNLSKIIYHYRRGARKNRTSYNDCFIMADTETSRSRTIYKEDTYYNYVCAWSIAIRSFNKNLVCLWGRKPSELAHCLRLISDAMRGDETFIYFHNLPYDWQFMRKFFIDEFGEPVQQLNTSKHKILFSCFSVIHDKKLIIKDSLPLAQVSLEKWAEILQVEHKKAVGKWDYDIIRDYNYIFSPGELLYMENDVLAGVECLEATCKLYNKNISSIPYTMTGFVREGFCKVLRKYHDQALALSPDYEDYIKLTNVYHGGYTHANRYIVNSIIKTIEGEEGKAYDFVSSYIFAIIAGRYPMGKFIKLEPEYNNIDTILKYKEDRAMFFRLTLRNFRLKDRYEPMPFIAWAKSDKDFAINITAENIDNGRVLGGGLVSFYTNEIDLDIILKQYEFDEIIITDLHMTRKEHLPRVFTDYVYSLYLKKCELKHGDPIEYARSKSMLNSCYGCMVQKNIQEEIIEDFTFYDDAEAEEAAPFYTEAIDAEELYNKYIKRQRFVLPYQWGVWVTAHASRNLLLGLCDCIEDELDEDGYRIGPSNLLYCDTDSGYGLAWNSEKVEAFNCWCKKQLNDNNYDFAIVNGEVFGLGTMDLDKRFTEFRTMGAKRYCYRDDKNKLNITVAGVPKRTGAKVLKDDIENFAVGTIFDGLTTGKKLLTYHYIKDIIKIDNDIEAGDFINLSPCDYLLDCTKAWTIDDYIEFVEHQYIYTNMIEL